MNSGVESISRVFCAFIGVTLFAFIGFRVVEIVEKKEQYISVNGLADRVVTSDSVTCTIDIARDTSQLKTVQEDRKKDKKAIRSFLKEKGIEEQQIEELHPSIENNRFSDKETEKTRYTISDHIKISSTDVQKVRKIVSELVQFMDDNVIGIVTCTEKYRYTDMENLRVQMIEEATKDAKNRALHIAGVTDSELIGLRNVSTGQFSIVSADASATEEYDWEGQNSIRKRVRVVVRCSFNI
jgi:hypothetical protein